MVALRSTHSKRCSTRSSIHEGAASRCKGVVSGCVGLQAGIVVCLRYDAP